ncbi:hypothetical protein SAMN04487905_10669 [Actinopolyspora xinjiangensis]|uniref:Uncharacterized protein n=1 Tax=Actinopolyspora xinjiangensis TaxID=405564 RepID=A0A1H0U6C5_9ACTN|nr:hypothetical protein SAMN04487905_10669 [Actinopolyspora xinjiangensis]
MRTTEPPGYTVRGHGTEPDPTNGTSEPDRSGGPEHRQRTMLRSCLAATDNVARS